MAAAKLYRYTPTGATLQFVSFHGSDYALCVDMAGKGEYYALKDLVEYDPGKGVTEKKPEPKTPITEKEEKDDGERRPSSIPMETRLNINLATAEMIADRLNGIGYKTAKEIVEKRSELAGERFTSLKQLEETTGRVDWKEIFKQDLVFLG